jgi:hypothetical protein
MKEALGPGFILVEIICLSTTEMIWWLCWLILHIATITRDDQSWLQIKAEKEITGHFPHCTGP